MFLTVPAGGRLAWPAHRRPVQVQHSAAGSEMPATEFWQHVSEQSHSTEGLGSCHTETSFHENFLWVKEGFYCLVFEKAHVARKVKGKNGSTVCP